MTQNQPKVEALWTRSYIFLLILSMLTSTCFNMIAPVLTMYAVSIGMTLTVAGILAGLFSIVALVARPFSGFASDKFNRKNLMIIATLLIACSTLAYSFSSNTYFLFSARIVHGFGFAISSTVSIALASMFIPKGRMGEGIGYFGFGFIISTAIGPSLGLAVSDHFGYQVTFTVSAFILFITALLMTRIQYQLPKRIITHEKFHFSLDQIIAKELIVISLFGGLFSLTNGLVTNFVALTGAERGIAHIGLFFTVTAFFMLLIRPFAGRLLDKKGLAIVLIPSFLLVSLGTFLLASADSLLIVLLAGILISFGQGAGQPSLMTECLNRFGTEKSGVASSTFFLGADIGQGIGPTIGGAISAAYGYGMMYYFSGVLLISGAIAFVCYNRFFNNLAKA